MKNRNPYGKDFGKYYETFRLFSAMYVVLFQYILDVYH